jgi:hypothetical protein
VSFIQPIWRGAQATALADSQNTQVFLSGKQVVLSEAARLGMRSPIQKMRQLPLVKCTTAPKIN